MHTDISYPKYCTLIWVYYSLLIFSAGLQEVETAEHSKATVCRAAYKVHTFISTMATSSPNPMFDHLLESSHRDDSNKWSNIGFGEEITQVELIEFNFMHLIWSSCMH